MSYLCTCGGRFKSHKIGEILIKKGLLYSVDSFRCENCGLTIIGGISREPICEAESDRGGKIIESMVSRGYNIYGRASVEKYEENAKALDDFADMLQRKTDRGNE